MRRWKMYTIDHVQWMWF